MAYPQGVPEVQAAGRRLQVSGKGLRRKTVAERGKGDCLRSRQGALPEGALRLTTAGQLSESAPEKRAGEGQTSVLAEGPLPR